MSFLPVFLLLLFLLIILDYHKRKKLILQIRRMPSEEKSDLLQKLIDPYGLSTISLSIQRTRGCKNPAAAPQIPLAATLLIRVLFRFILTITEKHGLSGLKKVNMESILAEKSGYTVLTTLSLPKTGIQPDLQVCRSLNPSICP